MTHTPRGLLSGNRLKERRRKFKYSRKVLKPRKNWNQNKYDPLVGAPQGTGIVLEKVQIEVKQPGSGLKKCVKVQLIKNGKVVTAFCAGEGAIKHIDEHDEVTIERIGGPQRGSMGDIPGVKFRVIGVAGISMPEILKGKKEKPVR